LLSEVTAKEQNNQYLCEDPIPAGCEVVKDDSRIRLKKKRIIPVGITTGGDGIADMISAITA
jgi:hypothetical protein